MKLLIVIVNYASADLTIDCLRSLAVERAGSSDFRVVVTDNRSPDDSVARLQQCIATEGWADWCQLRPLQSNGGFAYGNNRGFEDALRAPDPPDYVLLLNPDTVARPGALAAMIGFLDTHADVGLIGSRLEDPDGAPQISAFRFPGILAEFESGLRLGLVSRLLDSYRIAPPVQLQARPTDWVAGASLMIRTSVIDRIGPMDEGYFMYFEEVDWCLHARRAGFACWYVPEARVVHLVGQSSGVTDQKKPMKRRPRYWFESHRRYYRKNYGLAYTLLADLAWTIGFGIFQLRRLVQQKSTNDPPRLWRDFVRFNFLQSYK